MTTKNLLNLKLTVELSIAISIAAIAIVSCFPQKQQVINQIEPAVKKYVSSLGLGHIDSLIIYQVDTLSSAREWQQMGDEYNALAHEIIPELNKITEDMKFQQRMLDIQYSTYSSNAINDLREKAMPLFVKFSQYDSLAKNAFEMSTKADNKDFKGYMANFRIKYSDTLSGVQHSIDSAMILITKDFKIREKKDIVKPL